MNDDPTGIALRDHLDDVLTHLAPQPTLLQEVRAAHHRRTRRRAMTLAAGSALTAAAATAVVLLGATVGANSGGHHGRPPVPLTSPTYSQPQPPEEWFEGSFPLPRPTGEVVAIPMPAEIGDAANSQRSLLVWYNVPKDTFCAAETVQDPDHPDGWEGGGGGGGCTDTTPHRPWATQIVTGGSNCQGAQYWFGVIGVNASKVEVTGVGGPDPTLTLRGLDGAPSPFFAVTDIQAPALLFRYLDDNGKLVKQVTMPSHHVSPNGTDGCGEGGVFEKPQSPSPSG